jgi:hypothetical protein
MSYFSKGNDMANFELPKALELPTVPGRRLRPDDFKSEAFRRDAARREPEPEEVDGERSIGLERLAEALERRPVDEIAVLIRALTYADMIELAEGIWDAQPEGLNIAKDTLPNVLHRWSTSRTT